MSGANHPKNFKKNVEESQITTKKITRSPVKLVSLKMVTFITKGPFLKTE
jgi:hypothetical protein